MTILFFSRRFYPLIGGVEKHVMEIGRRLAKDQTVIVITEDPEGIHSVKEELDNMESINGIRIYRIPVGKENRGKKFKIWLWLWKNRKLLKQADIIHCHDVFFWYLPFRFLFPQKPVYTTFHGYEDYPVLKKSLMIRRVSEVLSWGNICIGDYIKKWYGTKPDYVTYGAVNLPSFHIQTSKKVKKESALFFGRLDDQTSILTYVKAFARLKKKYPTFEFLVVGDGKYRREVEKKVKVIGFQKEPEKYFSNYHFAFVSRYLSTLEAMAAKKLVFVVYDNPLKGDCFKLSPFSQWIILVDNEIDLVKKVTYYLSHPKEEKMLIDNAYIWVKKQTWENMVGIYLGLWKKARNTV